MAAQDAELKLRVSLDLAFFKQQLATLGTVAAGQTINIEFNRKAIQNELNALGANIRRRNYRLEVTTNLTAEIAKARELASLLRDMPKGNATGRVGTTQPGFSQAALKRISPSEIKRLYKAAADAGLIAFDTSISSNKEKIVKSLSQVGRDSVEGLLNGLKSGDAQLAAAASSLGNSLINSVKSVLGIASPSKKFEEIGRNVGKGFKNGTMSSMDDAFDALENKMRQRGKVLDTVARGIFKMLGMDPSAMMQQSREQRATPARPSIAGLLPSSTAKGRLGGLMDAGGGGASVAQGPGMLALSNEALGRRVNAILTEYFKVAEVKVREAFNPNELKQSLNVFSYIAQSLRDAETRTKRARIDQKVDSFITALELSIQTAQARLRVQSAQVRTVATQQSMLPAGRVAGLLPGRPSQASVLELNNILAGAIREYFAAVARGIKPSTAPQGRPLLGPGSTVAGLLPPAGGTTPRNQMRFNAVSTGAVLGQQPLMRAPNVPAAAGGGGGGAPPSGGGGRGGMGGMGGFSRAMAGVQLPGSGVIRELGDEFGMAAKQVLLFGTAYKALAFVTSFPAQVGAAVGALQSFNNTLKAISPTAEEAKASNQFILDIVDRYNVPLQSARDGFTKLYASMAPAGFKGDEIRDLFTGVSQAAATFGMSADKVDRVNYAFAQMASKGQVMSEELKGQLGDVLPGAMGIFAKAAGFEGTDAIQKFSKALEDGAYKGKPMRDLLKNVSIELQKEFGPGAEGAARTFQGAINRMQNSTKLLYEAFEPVAVGFLNAVVVPLTSGLKTVTDGFNAFFTGTQAKTAGGLAFAKELENLKPTFEGIRANLAALIPSFQLFGGVLLNVARFLATVAGNPITGFLLQVYTNVLLVNTAFTLLGGRILLNLITSINTTIARIVAMNVTMNALGVASTSAGTSIAGTKLQMMLLQGSAAAAQGPVNLLLGSLLKMAGIGAIAIAITIIVNGLAEMREAELRLARLRGEKDPVGPAGPRPIATAGRRYTGATREKVVADQQKQQEFVAQLRSDLKTAQGNVTTAEAANAVGAGGGILLRTAVAKRDKLILDIQNAEEVLNLDPSKFKTQAQINQATAAKFTVSGGGSTAAGGGSGEKAKKERESQLPMLQLELDKAKELFAIDQQLIGAQLADNASLVSSLELQKQLTELKYQGKQIALEQIPIEEKQAKMAALALEYEKAIMQSQLTLQLDMQKAREGLQQDIEQTLKGYEMENQYQQRYYDLIRQGISPALARIRLEVEKTFEKEKKRIDTLTGQYELQKASLNVQLAALIAQGNLSDIDNKRLADIKERIRLLDEELKKMGLLKGEVPGAQQAATTAAESAAGTAPIDVRLAELGDESRKALEKLQDPVEQIKTISDSVSESIGSAFKGLITGATTAQEALANVFQGIADSFADMVAEMITAWLKTQILQGFQSIFAPALGALGGGIGAANTAGGSLGGGPLSGAFQAGGPTFNPKAFSMPSLIKSANGNVLTGGFQAFANGGIVTGPTMGLVGEGRYNEAVVPLPDGRSIPVDMGGAMGGLGSQVTSNVTVNINNGQEQGGSGGNGSELGRKIEGAVKQVLVNELRPGGVLASGRR